MSLKAESTTLIPQLWKRAHVSERGGGGRFHGFLPERGRMETETPSQTRALVDATDSEVRREAALADGEQRARRILLRRRRCGGRRVLPRGGSSCELGQVSLLKPRIQMFTDSAASRHQPGMLLQRTSQASRSPAATTTTLPLRLLHNKSLPTISCALLRITAINTTPLIMLHVWQNNQKLGCMETWVNEM